MRSGLVRAAATFLLAPTAIELVPIRTAEAIPAFARKYALNCTACHTAPPRLNAYREANHTGIRLRGNVLRHYNFSRQDPPGAEPGTVQTKSELGFPEASSLLRQILLNLISNAIKFTQTGDVAVTLEQCSRKPSEVHLKFRIRDTGIGISQEAQARLFQAFSQADGSTTRRFGGTGLGLAIIKQLAHLMEGEVGVESSPGQGSTFWFTVRLATQLMESSRLQGIPLVALSSVEQSPVDSPTATMEDNLTRSERSVA